MLYATSTRKQEASRHTLSFAIVGLLSVVTVLNFMANYAARDTYHSSAANNAYSAHTDYAQTQEGIKAQLALGWKIGIALPRQAEPNIRLLNKGHNCLFAHQGCSATGAVSISAKDSQGSPLTGLQATIILSRPAEPSRDIAIPLLEKENGIYETYIDVPPGRWSFELDIDQDNQHMFRSSHRVVLN